MSTEQFPATFFRPSHSIALTATVMFLSVGFCLSAVVAQDAADGGPSKLPPPVEIHKTNPDSVTTADGVRLAVTYFPGTKGKETVPVILLHGHKGSSADYKQLAVQLQSEGHAVLIPDFRGHGDSTQRLGSTTLLNAGNVRPINFIHDVEVLKNFLWKKNNEQELNIDKLCIVGADIGASVALTWARLDWIRPPIGHVKQGQDVKALVLISPVWSSRGLLMSVALNARPMVVQLGDPQLRRILKDGDALQLGMPVELDFRKEVSVMVLSGSLDRRAVADAKRVHKMLKRYHPEPPENERAEKKDLFYGTLETKLQGTKMLGANLNLEEHIIKFIELRAVNRPFPWSRRVRDPYSDRN